MSWKNANFAESTLLQAAASGDTTIYIDEDDALLFPTLPPGDKATAVIFNATYREIVNITAITDGALTVERAQETTSARVWEAGTRIVQTPTATVFAAILATPVAFAFTGTATYDSGTNTYTVDVGVGNPLPSLNDGETVSFLVPADSEGADELIITDGTSPTTSKPLLIGPAAATGIGDLQEDWLATVEFNSTEDGWVLTSRTSFHAEADQLNDDAIPGINRHPNGFHEAWTSGTSFLTPASGDETADGWFVEYDGTIGTFTVLRRDFDPSQDDVPGANYYLRWDHSSAGSASSFRRLRVPIPDVDWRDADTVIRKIYLKADAARSVTARIIQNFGTGGAPSADVVADSEVLNLTTDWQAFTIFAVLPSVAGKTFGTDLNHALELELNLPINTTMTIDVAADDLRPGIVPGLNSRTWPLPWWQGGVGGSFRNGQDFLDRAFPSLGDLNALTGNGVLVRDSSDNVIIRSLAVGTGLSIANPTGDAGNPTISPDTDLANYVADPLSTSELASITGDFGTAAFVADNGLVHIAGIETITANKNFLGAVDAALQTWENTTTTHEMEARWAAAGVAFEFTPSPSGTPDATKGFGYNITDARWFCDTNLLVAGQVLAAAGSVTNPGLVVGANQIGFYESSASVIACSIAGVAKWSTSSTVAIDALQPLRGTSGGASAPTFGHRTNTDTGMFFPTIDSVGWSINNSLKMDIDASRLLLASGIDVVLNSATGPSSTHSVGFRGAPATSGEKNSSYTGVLADAGSSIPHTAVATFTIPPNASVAYPIGTVIFLPNLNGSGVLTVHPDTGVTLRRGDGTAGTGDRTIPTDAGSSIWKRGTNEWYIYGNFA